MKTFYTIAIFCLLATIVQSQCTPEGRYRDFIFPGHVKTADVNYGENIGLDGTTEQLMMDVYIPEGDVATDRAVVIICHGGYFLYGDKAEADVVPFCEDLTRMGYVVASINYRMGIEFTTPLSEPYGREVVKAVQDLRAAIRWFRKDVAEGNNQFGIDPTEIYTGGDSAGGFMGIHLAYMDEWEIPSYIDMSYPGLEGGLEGESGNAGYPSDVNAIFNISGAIGDTAWISVDDTTPACLFHGDNDQTVPFDSDMFYLFGLIEVVDLDGSNPIDQKMTELGIEHCFEVNEGYGHVAYMGNPEVYDTTLSILSNFLSHYICGVELDCDYREIQDLTSVSELKTSDVFVYPNPASSSFVITGTDRKYFNRVRIFNSFGKEVKSKSLTDGFEIETVNLAAGVYLLKLEGDSNKKNLKLVIK